MKQNSPFHSVKGFQMLSDGTHGSRFILSGELICSVPFGERFSQESVPELVLPTCSSSNFIGCY